MPLATSFSTLTDSRSVEAGEAGCSSTGGGSGASPDYVLGFSSLLSDDVDRDLHRRRHSSVFKPVCGVSVLGPADSRPIVRSHPISMIGDRSLQDVDHARPVYMVVNRAEDASGFDAHQTHSKLAPCHALDFRAKVKR